MSSLQDLAIQTEPFQAVLRDVLFLLYDSDILEEDVIISWYNRLSSAGTDVTMRKKLRTQVSGSSGLLIAG